MLMRLTLALLVTTIFSSTEAADKQDCAWVKRVVRVVAQERINVGPPGHQIVYTTRFDTFEKSGLPSFVGGQSWTYNVGHDTKGTGSHSGWFEWTGKNNDKLFGTYRGTHANDGSKATWQGTYEITGGGGQYERAKGGGEYKGSAGPDGAGDSGTCTVSF
jgi:hypothetical protein